MMTSEQTTLYRLRAGDSKAFESLYTLWSGKLYNFVMRISRGDGYLAEKVVQSVFIKIWEKRQELDLEKSFSSYICTIAKNQLINIYQHRMLEFLYQENVLITNASFDNTTEEEVEYRLLDDYVNTLIEKMPPARREIFRLSRHEFLSNKEIAGKLNLSENTVESQLTKATSFLRTQVAKHYNMTLTTLLFLYINSR